jgi:hypothetical protein
MQRRTDIFQKIVQNSVPLHSRGVAMRKTSIYQDFKKTIAMEKPRFLGGFFAL